MCKIENFFVRRFGQPRQQAPPYVTPPGMAALQGSIMPANGGGASFAEPQKQFQAEQAQLTQQKQQETMMRAKMQQIQAEQAGGAAERQQLTKEGELELRRN